MNKIYSKSKHEMTGFFAIKSGEKAIIVGKCVKDAAYVVDAKQEVITAPTLEDLKTLLTERGLTFNETPIRPIS